MVFNKAFVSGLLGCLPALVVAALPLVAKAAEAPSAADRLVAAEPALAALAAAVGQAVGDKQREAQLQWLAGREAACPAVAPGAGKPSPKGTRRELAVDCLERLYEQRLAVLTAERNAAAWPHLRFRPALVEGGGDKLCEDLHRDLVASFLGRGLAVNPLGEREVGFAPIDGLEDDAHVALRADIDLYNNGKPVPVVEWISDSGGSKPASVQYLLYPSEGALLAAIGRGIEPLTQSVRDEGKPIVDLAALPRPDPSRKRPRAFFADAAVLPVDLAGHFFRDEGKLYLLAPVRPAAEAPGDLGVYRLAGPGQIQRRCLFDAHLAAVHAADRLPEVAALDQAAAPLLPTGRLCEAVGDGPRTLDERALWRPWALDHPWPGETGFGRAQLALYLKNRALTGPEPQRQYRAFLAARNAAVGAVAAFYQAQFGRTPEQARELAALYLDRGIADRFVFDPDDEAVAALFAADYARRHQLQQAALAGDTEALRAALRLEPVALAAGAKGALDETLLTDALEHPETLAALLDMGLDPNQAGNSGRTPLMVAARLDLVEAAKLLLVRGADPDAGAGDAVAQSDLTGDAQCMKGAAGEPDTPGRTALSYAAERASPQMVRLLLERHAGKDKPDGAGRRPADYLARRGGDPGVKAAIAALLK